MIKMSLIKDIKEAGARGVTTTEISKHYKIDRKTVRKYMQLEDFNEEFPFVVERESILDPFKIYIHQWLDEDKAMWHKQRHTAKRIYDRLYNEKGYRGSYPTVQRYVKKCKEQAGEQPTYLPLVWHPGQAQADFGQADFMTWQGIERMYYFVLSFPNCNQAFTQVFRGETSECVCQGLMDIFDYIGGVPSVLIVDNASGIGRRIGDVISECKLFMRFRLHYNFQVRYCNPNSGHEKGHVENKVGTVRRNLFVPIPKIDRIEAYNRELLEESWCEDTARHYKKGRKILDLFEEDRNALRPLPRLNFDVVRYENRKADKYGKVQLDGPHLYSSLPQAGLSELVVGIRAHTIHVYDKTQRVLSEHRRHFGKQASDSSDPYAQLEALAFRPGAWFNSELRASLTTDLQALLDNLETSDRTNSLLILRDLTQQYPSSLSIEALKHCLQQDKLSPAQAQLYASLLDSGIDPVERSLDFNVYDSFLIPREVE